MAVFRSSKRLELRIAERRGQAVAAEYGGGSLPIDPLAVAAAVGIQVFQRPLAGCFGCLLKVGDRFAIVTAESLANEGMRRFTLAHELGHYFLEGHPEQLFPTGVTEHRSESGFVSSELHERQADHFAAGLLMPESLFRAAARQAEPGLQGVRDLAELCQTSLTATAIRWARFIDDPAAIVVSQGERVSYCFMSKCLQELRGVEWLPTGSRLPTNSHTFGFNRDLRNIELARDVSGSSGLDDWFSGAPELEMQEEVIGLGPYGRTLTILHSDESLPDPDEEPDEEE